MRKGQTEMIGLVIVMVLLVVGALFYVRFGILGKKNVKEDISLDVNYASNLLNSMLNVKICDRKTGLDEGMITCFNGGKICEQEACDYLKSEIQAIIDSVGLEKYKDYSVWVESKGRNEFISNNCRTGVKVDSKVVGENKIAYQVNLQLC